MTRIFGDPASFVPEALAGFGEAYADFVQLVPGGVIRSTATPPGKVVVLVGGGSGHYPAFAGYVGPGLADGAVCGDVFASPSARLAYDVAKAADKGGGVIFAFGNYAGDILNFGLAAERLAADGTPAQLLVVTDDVASEGHGANGRRRGIAGGVVVFKVAGAAAEAGYDLEAVLRVASRANERTRTMGVAFSGCTVPGQPDPLFTVPPGRMAVGLGIHGEPGISESPVASPAELAELLLTNIVKAAPDDAGRRVAVLVNGLGSTKYEELFLLFGHVSQQLRADGYELVAPAVGELVTSLDMAGASLTLTWLDEELEQLWLAPAHCPAFHRGAAIETTPAPRFAPTEEAPRTYTGTPAQARESGQCVSAAIAAVAAALADAETELGRLDAVAGDGDHGVGMSRGSAAAARAAATAAVAGAGASSVLTAAADAWADRAGGTSGVVWGVLLRAFAAELDDIGLPSAPAVARGARTAIDDVCRLGGATLGDKTLVDAMEPFAAALAARVAAGDDLRTAWQAAADAATQAAEATKELRPRIGRARPLAERSVGHPDAGAVSFAIAVSAAAPAVGARLPAMPADG